MSAIDSLWTWVHSARRRAKTFVGARPGLFFPLFRPRPAFDGLLVTTSTDICIEGFPRSANSFAVGAFRHAQPHSVEVAHHTHVPANAIRACEWGLPTLILVRAPYDAIVSRIALGKETQRVGQNIGSPQQRVSFAAWIHAWCSFYRAVAPHRDQERLLAVPFAAAIADMGRVIEHVNARYGTDFVPFDHTDEAVATVHAEQGYHAGPNDRREQLKADTRSDFDNALRSDPALRSQMDAAEQLFESYVESAVVDSSPT